MRDFYGARNRFSEGLLYLLPGLFLFVGTSVPIFALPQARAADPFRFPEGKYKQAELKYRNGIPVLTVEGTPEEIGEQIALLAGKHSARLLDYPKDVLELLATPTGARLLQPLVLSKGRKLLENFPVNYRKEFEAMVKTSGFDRDRMIIGNTAFDLTSDLGNLFGCSALIVEAGRSTTDQPLFGRNMDLPSAGYLHEYTLVTVYRPRGKRMFVSVGYPGLVGCISGINDAGLVLAALESTGAPKDEGPAYNMEGVPFALLYRRIMEECATIEEAVKLLGSAKRTTTNILAICEAKGGAVIEFSPSRVAVRRPEKDATVCTNHFCTKELKLAQPRNVKTTLDRFATLTKVQNGGKKLGVAEIHAALDATNQGDETLQTMIFEPATWKLHLAVAAGGRPASSQRLQLLDLSPLLKK